MLFNCFPSPAGRNRGCQGNCKQSYIKYKNLHVGRLSCKHFNIVSIVLRHFVSGIQTSKNLYTLGMDHYFPWGSIVISRRQHFFSSVDWALAIFPLNSLCRQFFKFPKFPTAGVASGDNFFQMHLWGRHYFSNFSHADNFFPNRDTSPPPPLRGN